MGILMKTSRVFYSEAFLLLIMLLNIKNSMREKSEQREIPANIPMLPLSMLPITPKKATKQTVERMVFSTLTAAAEVKKATMVQIREIRPSPKLVLME